jgi:hypothetical protein
VPPTEWTDQDVANRMHTAPHVAVICPVRNMTVPVVLELHHSEPGVVVDDWDHVAECSLAVDSGQLELHESGAGPVARMNISPGTYRVRALYGNLESLSPSGLEGDDHYIVVMWPAKWAPLVVLKQWSGDIG